MKMQKLSELTSLLSGFAFNASLFNDEKMGLPLIRVRDVNSGFAGFYYSGSYDQQFVVTKGDILISLDGDFKAIEWKGDEALLNQRVCKIIPNEDLLNREYLLHFLPEILKDIHRKTRYTTVKHLSTKTINSIEIPVPSLPDQRHIAQLLSQAEQLIAQRQESLRLLDAYLKSTFLEMFGGVKDNKYSSVSLESVAIKITDGTHLSPKFLVEGVPFLLVSNIVENEIHFQTKKYISEEEYLLLNKRTPIEPGDILITSVGSYGNAALVRGFTKFAFQRHIAYIKPDHQKINNIYLFGALRSEFVQIQIEKAVRGVAQKTLNLTELRKLQVPIPPLALQTQFAQIVTQTELLKTQYQQSLAELEQLYGSLSQRAFRGELV